MSLSAALASAQTGLKASALRADVVATNVANANTPGYVRRSVLLSEKLLEGQTAGVRIEAITRAGDAAATAQRREVSSDLANAQVRASAWQALSTRLGDSTDASSLFKTLSTFETELADLATTPESGAQREAVLGAARSIINDFADLSELATDLRAEADAEIAAGVETVNTALKWIQELNSKIASVQEGTSQAAALEDERNRALDTIAEYLPIDAIERERGSIDIITPEGVFLLAGEAMQLEFNASAAFGPDKTLASGDLSGLSVQGKALTPGASEYSAISSGMFAALFTVRDTDMPAFSAQLDTLAEDLVSRFSDDSIDPTKTPGEAGLFVDSDPTAGAGLAGRLSLNAAIDPEQGGQSWRLRDGIGATVEGEAGNNTILNNMLDAFQANQPINANGLQGAFSATGLTAHLSSLVGQSQLQSEALITATTTQYETLAEAEQRNTGVDIDQQMQELILVEQAYAANARVVEVINKLIDKLLEY